MPNGHPADAGVKPDYAFQFNDLAVLLAAHLPACGARRPVPADAPPGYRMPALSPSPADGGLIKVPEGPP